MIKPWMFGLLSLAWLGAHMPAQAAYSMKVTATFPKGSSGEKPAARYATNTKTAPCDDPATFDAVTFTMTYEVSNTKKQADRDVYLILSNPEGIAAPKFLVLKKRNLGSQFDSLARNDIRDISRTGDVYLPRAENLSAAGAFTETIISSAISLQGAASGIWTLTGIIGDGQSNLFNLDDPATWDAWDTATIMLRKPWVGNIKTACE
jgi:hypothetical protein